MIMCLLVFSTNNKNNKGGTRVLDTPETSEEEVI